MFSEKALKEVPSENCHKVRDEFTTCTIAPPCRSCNSTEIASKSHGTEAKSCGIIYVQPFRP